MNATGKSCTMISTVFFKLYVNVEIKKAYKQFLSTFIYI
jgi:hypothetical protein